MTDKSHDQNKPEPKEESAREYALRKMKERRVNGTTPKRLQPSTPPKKSSEELQSIAPAAMEMNSPVISVGELLASLPPLSPEEIAKRKRVAQHLKDRLSHNPFHADRAKKESDAYWRSLAASSVNLLG